MLIYNISISQCEFSNQLYIYVKLQYIHILDVYTTCQIPLFLTSHKFQSNHL